jgi:hypothetical protein
MQQNLEMLEAFLVPASTAKRMVKVLAVMDAAIMGVDCNNNNGIMLVVVDMVSGTEYDVRFTSTGWPIPRSLWK